MQGPGMWIGKKILVVDDEDQIVQLLEEGLKREGFKVITAKDGKAAVDQVKKERPDLILLDINLTKMSGFEVLKSLKGDKKTMGIPIFMLTGRTDQADVEKGVRNYADKYITKPFDFIKLVDDIRKTLALR